MDTFSIWQLVVTAIAAVSAPIIALLARAWSGEFSLRTLHRLERLVAVRAALADQGLDAGPIDRHIAAELARMETDREGLETEARLDRKSPLRRELLREIPWWKRSLSCLGIGYGVALIALGVMLLFFGFAPPDGGPQDIGFAIFSAVFYPAIGLAAFVPAIRWRRRALGRLYAAHLAEPGGGDTGA
ncbi:hypothetical protein [Demequina mangrovi]|uniref:Uncharacterized protein n=1 Tax=Demequina mangrovi TaxID=1043493 RepID=A0A1H6Z1N7_9MICO|nr:hypothetical protein [Demequina mangrovi]SEJ46576.1 hypothetical protein SAMN05421637_1881 [Demequina mangrovi]